MIYYNIGKSFIELLKEYLNKLENYNVTNDEQLLNDIKELIKIRGIEL